MNEREVLCGYCGSDDKPITRDHVIPKALWKDAAMPSSPLTIPACRDCQLFWDGETTYFRNIMVVQSDIDAHPALKRLLNGAISRRIKHSRPDFTDLTRNATPVWRQSQAGFYIERGVKIEIDMARFQRTPEKIVRGLFFMRNQIVLPDDYEVRVFPNNSFWDDMGFQQLLDQMDDWQGCGDDVFQMRAVRDGSDNNFTAWLLMFFKSSAIFAYTCPRSCGQNAA